MGRFQTVKLKFRFNKCQFNAPLPNYVNYTTDQNHNILAITVRVTLSKASRDVGLK